MRWMFLSPIARGNIVSCTVSMTCATLVRKFLVEPRFIPSGSMRPTFCEGDKLFVDKVSSSLGRRFRKRDVVVFHGPDRCNTVMIKRIVAMSGETIEVREGLLFVDGVPQFEDFILDDPQYSMAPAVVPDGMVAVFGDNRNFSYDSHVWGWLPVDRIIGRAVAKFWPPNRIGWVEGTQNFPS